MSNSHRLWDISTCSWIAVM